MSNLSNALRSPVQRPIRITCPAGRVQVHLAVEDPEAYEALEVFYATPGQYGPVGDRLTPPRVREALKNLAGIDVPTQTISKHRAGACSCSPEKLEAAIEAQKAEVAA